MIRGQLATKVGSFGKGRPGRQEEMLAGNLGGVVFVLAVQGLIGNPHLALVAMSALALPGVVLATRLPAHVPSHARVIPTRGPSCLTLRAGTRPQWRP